MTWPSRSTLGQLPAAIARPRYDRTYLRGRNAAFRPAIAGPDRTAWVRGFCRAYSPRFSRVYSGLRVDNGARANHLHRNRTHRLRTLLAAAERRLSTLT